MYDGISSEIAFIKHSYNELNDLNLFCLVPMFGNCFGNGDAVSFSLSSLTNRADLRHERVKPLPRAPRFEKPHARGVPQKAQIQTTNFVMQVLL